MNTVQTNTDTASVVTAEPQTQKPARKATLPTIARRKVLQGKHKQPGAPKLEVIGLHKNRRRGAFTKHDIFDANGQTISLLTITKRIRDLRKAGELVKMAKSLKHTGPGRPPEYFNFDLTQGEAKKSRSRKVKAETTTVTEAPVVVAPEAAPAPEAVPVPAPEAVPAPAAEPAVV